MSGVGTGIRNTIEIQCKSEHTSALHCTAHWQQTTPQLNSRVLLSVDFSDYIPHVFFLKIIDMDDNRDLKSFAS